MHLVTHSKVVFIAHFFSVSKVEHHRPLCRQPQLRYFGRSEESETYLLLRTLSGRDISYRKHRTCFLCACRSAAGRSRQRGRMAAQCRGLAPQGQAHSSDIVPCRSGKRQCAGYHCKVPSNRRRCWMQKNCESPSDWPVINLAAGDQRGLSLGWKISIQFQAPQSTFF